MNRVFVYGTLKKGHGNHHYLTTSTYLGKCVTEPLFTLINYGMFPAAITEGNTAISGEVYDVTDRVLAALDRLEGVEGGFYSRTRINTAYGEAWMYTMTVERVGLAAAAIKAATIHSGIWAP